jgi:hypothetical protein
MQASFNADMGALRDMPVGSVGSSVALTWLHGGVVPSLTTWQSLPVPQTLFIFATFAVVMIPVGVVCLVYGMQARDGWVLWTAGCPRVHQGGKPCRSAWPVQALWA